MNQTKLPLQRRKVDEDETWHTVFALLISWTDTMEKSKYLKAKEKRRSIVKNVLGNIMNADIFNTCNIPDLFVLLVDV